MINIQIFFCHKLPKCTSTREIPGLIFSGKNLGFPESASEVFADAKWQRCTVHFFRNVFTKVPRNKFAAVAALLKATYAQEDREATLAKTTDVEHKLHDMKLNSAADVYARGVKETRAYLEFPHGHWRNIQTNNTLEHLNWQYRENLHNKVLFLQHQESHTIHRKHLLPVHRVDILIKFCIT